MLRVGGLVFGRLDWEGGQFTYGNRIAIGKILSHQDWTEYHILREIYREVYGYSCRWLVSRAKRYKVLSSIGLAIKGWVDKEQQLLKYEPTDEEIRAGCKMYSERVGELATIKAIAKDFGRNPDEVVGWQYSKVFGILLANLEEYKYQQRLNKVMNEKYKRSTTTKGTR